MKIVVFGAAGDIGRRVVAEALSRGHEITAVVRGKKEPNQFPSTVNVEVCNVTPGMDMGSILKGKDLVISALRPPEGFEPLLVPLTFAVLEAASAVNVRTLIVGGAASLRLPDKKTTVLTEPGFLPAEVVPIARACQDQYELCKSFRNDNWSYLCPPAILVPGERTGRYQLGTDMLVTNADGVSQISIEDFAVALLEEAEHARHTGERFTVAA